MRTRNLVGLIVATMSMVICLAGCGEKAGPAQVDRESAQAQPNKLVVTKVEPISIPADPNLPNIIVVVDDFVMAASGVTSGGGTQTTPTIINSGGGFLGGQPAVVNLPTGGGQVINPGEQIGRGVTAQLISALQRVGNVTLIDRAFYEANKSEILAKLKPGERLFIIGGAVTKFAETVDSSSQGESKGPNPADLMFGVIGTVKYGIDSMKGRKTTMETKHVGMVGLDIKIIDPTTGKITASFPAEGTFTTVSMTVSETKGGDTTVSSDSAASALGQAQVAALNDAITKIHKAIVGPAAIAQR